MRKKFTLAILALSWCFYGIYAQGEMDAFNLSYNSGIKGTARSVGMGNAMGALGGDISAIAINPAGIGPYTKSEFVTTIDVTKNKAETKLTGIKTDQDKTKFGFDNIAFVTNIPTLSDVAPLINVGASYSRLKSFDRNISLNGQGLHKSQTDYISARVDGISNDGLIKDPFSRGAEYWLGGLAYNTGIIQNKNNSSNTYESSLNNLNEPKLYNNLRMKEKGYIDTYDFNIGTTFSDMLSVGLTFSVTDLNYQIYSDYTEDWYSGDKYSNNGYNMQNWMETDGTGFQVKVGTIFKPIPELRIGVAYHSPTWYELTDKYTVDTSSEINGKQYYIDSWYDNGVTYTDYKLKTPDKWVFSLAGVIDQRFILSADYELTNYKNMHLKDDRGWGNDYSETNSFIKSDFKNASTLRVGGEARITNQLSARVGYMWQQSPVQKKFKDNNEKNGSEEGIGLNDVVATAGTITQFSLVGDANTFTWGLGYKFTPSIYADIAFAIQDRKDDLYTFTGSNKAELKNTSFSSFLTFGCRF